MEEQNNRLERSHPTWVCGLKQSVDQQIEEQLKSHPTWVCGLKHPIRQLRYWIVGSHPTWVCGLKHSPLQGLNRMEVTPYVGVWIETF